MRHHSRPWAVLCVTLWVGAIQGSLGSTAEPTNPVLSANPLLSTGKFPLWDQITADQIIPAVKQVLAEETASLELLEKDLAAAGSNITFDRIFNPYRQIRMRVDFVTGQFDHLASVVNTPELRDAVQSITPDRVSFELRFGQSQAIYNALKTLKNNAAAWNSLRPDQQRLVDITYRDMANSGVGLSEADRQRLSDLVQELSQLSTEFSNNVLDSTAAFKLVVTDRSQLDGLSNTTLLVAALNAQAAGHTNATRDYGPWILQLGDSTYAAVISFAHDRSLREKMYKAYTNVATTAPWDNTPIIEKILSLRLQLANLLGYPNWAKYKFTTKMATLEQATAKMQEIIAASKPVAVKEHEQLTAFARETLNDTAFELKWWDTSYWAERQKEKLYNVRADLLREYLPLDSVIGGLFKLAEKLYGVSITLADPQPPTWHPDVRVFQVSNLNSSDPIAYFYADLFARPGSKSGGAWENSFQSRSSFWKTPSPAAAAAMQNQPAKDVNASAKDAVIYSPRLAKVQADWLQAAPSQLPLVIIVGNQDPPSDGRPALMTMGDARTLFHEMGHAFMDLLAASQEGLMAGNRNVEIDAIETPSQMQEKWVYDPRTFNTFARHWLTGEAVPDAVFKQIAALQKYRTGFQFVRQLTFAMTDLRLHSEYVPGGNKSAGQVYLDTFEEINPTSPYPDDHFLNDFKHIFAGGYEAGYYSYMWADIMSADIYEAFVAGGLDNDTSIQKLGHHFRDTFPSLGGSVAPAEVFRKMMGRDPDVKAMLRYNGLLAKA